MKEAEAFRGGSGTTRAASLFEQWSLQSEDTTGQDESYLTA